MAEQLFLYGVYSIHVRPISNSTAHAGTRNTKSGIARKPSSRGPPIGGDSGYGDEAEAVAAAHQQAVDDIEHGAGIPKPRAFP